MPVPLHKEQWVRPQQQPQGLQQQRPWLWQQRQQQQRAQGEGAGEGASEWGGFSRPPPLSLAAVRGGHASGHSLVPASGAVGKGLTGAGLTVGLGGGVGEGGEEKGQGDEKGREGEGRERREWGEGRRGRGVEGRG